MKLRFDELQYLTDGEIMLQKINDVVSLIREKGIGADIPPYLIMEYKENELSLLLGLTVPARLPLQEKKESPNKFLDVFLGSN